MNTILRRVGAGVLAIGLVSAVAPVKVEAATIYASSAEIIANGPRGTANDRANIKNAFGTPDGKFFELGYNAVVEFQFGVKSGQRFSGPGSLIEISFNNDPNWKEAVQIEVGLKGVADSFIIANPSFVNIETFANPVFTFNGIFDTVRLTDLTWSMFGGNSSNRSTRASTGGFDVDSISVNAVPLPAAGFLLIGALAGMGVLRRRRKTA